MTQIRRLGLTTLLFLMVSVASVFAWGTWQNAYGNGLIQLKWTETGTKDIAGHPLWTWAVRNASTRTLTSCTMVYETIDGGNYVTKEEILPYSLQPGANVGGWTCYTASGTRWTIRLKDVEFK